MTLMRQLEEQYSTQTAEITAKIGRLVLNGETPSSDVAELRSQLAAVERSLTEVDDVLDQMELCARDTEAGSALRSKQDKTIESYRRDKLVLDGELTKATRRLQSQIGRHELLGGPETSTGLNEDQRSRLINNTERLERTGRKLDDTYRMIVETEEIGAATLRDLSDQRDTIQRSRNRLANAEGELGTAGQTLNRMIARIVQDRVLVLVVIFVLVVFALFLFYIKF